MVVATSMTWLPSSSTLINDAFAPSGTGVVNVSVTPSQNWSPSGSSITAAKAGSAASLESTLAVGVMVIVCGCNSASEGRLKVHTLLSASVTLSTAEFVSAGKSTEAARERSGMK